MSDSLRLHGLQHARLPYPSSTPVVYSNSCPSSQWCHLIIWRPLLLPPSIFPSIRVFSNESVLQIRWPEYWSFNFSINPSNPHLEGTVNESTAKEQRLSLCPLRVPPAGSWGFQMVLRRASHAGSEKEKLCFWIPSSPAQINPLFFKSLMEPKLVGRCYSSE